MQSAKQEALAAINALPDETSFEEIVYRLYVLEHIRAGLAELEAGEGVGHEEVKAELSKWLDD
jgi:predicted transcriptional regulator